MTGRGRGKKEDKKCPDTQLTKCKTRPAEKKPQTTKEQKPKEQKKTNHTEEMPSVQSTQKEKTTTHFTEINKQQRMTTDNTEAPVQGAKAKTPAGRAKAPGKPAAEIKPTQTPRDTTKDLKTTKAKVSVETAEETTKTLPQAPNNNTDASVQITKPKTRARKVKPPQQIPEETTKTETQKDSPKITKAERQVKFAVETPKVEPETPKAPATTKKAKCAAKAKQPQQLAEDTTKIKTETLKDTTRACVPEDKAAVDSLLHTTLKKLKIKMNDRSAASEVVNAVIKSIFTHMKQNTKCFAEVQEPLRTGSYYENLKISNPDEFDVMLPIPVDRVSIEPFGDDGAFYSVGLKRGKSPLEKFQEDSTLSASKMLKEFREEVKKCVKEFTEWEVTKKKKGCPAVTLTTNVQSSTISLDVVLSLVVKSSWPPFTNEGLKIEGWLGRKVKRDYKRKEYYLVPKYEGKGAAKNNGVLAEDAWRVSFSHIEKAILMNHGSEKTCCEEDGARCYRKDCLKLLKHLLSLLKEKDSSFDKFCSYHAKTTLLHACCSRTKDSEWRDSSLSQCFQQLLKDFVEHLESGVLNNFFIPTQNLLSGPGKVRCKSLARSIREECDEGFPIFE